MEDRLTEMISLYLRSWKLIRMLFNYDFQVIVCVELEDRMVVIDKIVRNMRGSSRDLSKTRS
jgi:hypothetical protein